MPADVSLSIRKPAAARAKPPSGGLQSAPLLPPLPAICVFDLDYTLWPLDVDCEATPFSLTPDGGAAQSADRVRLAPFPHSPQILAALFDAGVRIAFASRTTSAAAAEALLRLLPLPARAPPLQGAGAGASGGAGALCYWDALRGDRRLFQAYSSRGRNAKQAHFAALQEATGLPFHQFMFFDDLHENVAQAEAQGVTCVLLDEEGLTWAAFEGGLQKWREAAAGRT